MQNDRTNDSWHLPCRSLCTHLEHVITANLHDQRDLSPNVVPVNLMEKISGWSSLDVIFPAFDKADFVEIGTEYGYIAYSSDNSGELGSIQYVLH